MDPVGGRELLLMEGGQHRVKGAVLFSEQCGPLLWQETTQSSPYFWPHTPLLQCQ